MIFAHDNENFYEIQEHIQTFVHSRWNEVFILLCFFLSSFVALFWIRKCKYVFCVDSTHNNTCDLIEA